MFEICFLHNTVYNVSVVFCIIWYDSLCFTMFIMFQYVYVCLCMFMYVYNKVICLYMFRYVVAYSDINTYICNSET